MGSRRELNSPSSSFGLEWYHQHNPQQNPDACAYRKSTRGASIYTSRTEQMPGNPPRGGALIYADGMGSPPRSLAPMNIMRDEDGGERDHRGDQKDETHGHHPHLMAPTVVALPLPGPPPQHQAAHDAHHDRPGAAQHPRSPPLPVDFLEPHLLVVVSSCHGSVELEEEMEEFMLMLSAGEGAKSRLEGSL